MPQPQVSTLFPNDEFIPEIFSLEERAYLRDHIGDKPSVMMEDPPPEGCNIPTLQVALTRLFDDEDVERVRGMIVKSIDRSFKLYERKMKAKQTGDRHIPYGQLGVGNGRRQSKIDRTGAVKLSSVVTTSEKFFDDLLSEEEKQTIVTGEAVGKEAFRVECGYCDDDDRFYNTTANAIQSVGTHIRRVHEEHIKQFNAMKPELKKLIRNDEQRIVVVSEDGITFRARTSE